MAGKHDNILDDIKRLVEEKEAYSSIKAQLVIAEVEPNMVKNFLVVSRKLNSYDLPDWTV